MGSNSVVRILAALLPLSLLGGAIAQYDIRPFADDPVGISAAFGAEMAVLRLEAAEALFAEGVEVDEIEEALEGLEVEFMRFGAALEVADPDLLERTREAFAAIEEAEEAEDQAAAVSEALPVAYEVREAVSAPLVADPAYAGAVMSLLLVSETGVAEGWEEAVEGEVGPYAIGWAGMSRLYELWETVKPQADENQVFEIEDQLSALQDLFQNPTPPNMEGADPEEGEGAAVHVAGFLEDATGAWLFPDRDLAALLGNTQEVATQACEAYQRGDTLAGDANLVWVTYAFNEYLTGTLGMFAPEPTAELNELLDDEGEDFDPTASCEPLLAAFGEAGSAFGL
ncbi:MAG: hypothetical protein WD273_14495 [Trueperaceae bacterium]